MQVSELNHQHTGREMFLIWILGYILRMIEGCFSESEI